MSNVNFFLLKDVTSKYLVWATIGIILPLLLVYFFNGNIFKFQFVFFLVQASVLGYLSFKAIHDIRLKSENQTTNFLTAWLSSFLILALPLILFLVVKMLLLFILDTAYLNDCIEKIRIEILQLAEKDERLVQAAKDLDKLKEISSHYFYFAYYPIKSLVLSALIALIARKK
ncbi:MAG: DUF4199 family protein [Bacteroidales bacterium]|nr:DUF4199 family protein [Bacteroidales bacterium]